MLFKEDKVARADAEAIRKGVGFYRWTHDLVEITGENALEVLQKIYISDISRSPSDARNTPPRWMKTARSSTT